MYDIAFDALRDPAALQLALCLAQVEKSAQVYAGIAPFSLRGWRLRNGFGMFAEIYSKPDFIQNYCTSYRRFSFLQMALKSAAASIGLATDVGRPPSERVSSILDITDIRRSIHAMGSGFELSCGTGARMHNTGLVYNRLTDFVLLMSKILQAGISTETWQAFAMDDPIRPPPSDAEIDADLTMAVTLSLKLLCNMLDAAKILQQLSLCSQVIKLLEGGKITQLLAPPPPQRSRSVPIKVSPTRNVGNQSIR